MAPGADTLAVAGHTGTSVFAAPGREIILPVAEEAAAGTLTLEIDTVLPLTEAADNLAIR
ncbi:hypothetical protein HNR02_007052 [Amycolatopsis endophytica]|uniref:Uncharacterized protein n=1 Tax=Amycolatopsis endophytica TaxID=860233 RepID=A0A853BGK3_9PSEU|nr:hypothetical protein [Amycolatopsis endophytica]NYI93677.1 hypothetical protein [Amycolatopsis endophytica]